MQVKEISVLVDKKYSANYNSVGVQLGAVVSVDAEDDADKVRKVVFAELDAESDTMVQKLLDEM